MSQYTIYRCSNVEEYLEKVAEYRQAEANADLVRAKGFVVHVTLDIPLPPEGYPDDFTIEAKGLIL